MHTVLLFAQVAGHWNERLDTEDTARVLIILGQLTEDREQLLNNVLPLKLSGKVAELRGTNSLDHRRVVLAELEELAAQPILLSTSTRVGIVEKAAC